MKQVCIVSIPIAAFVLTRSSTWKEIRFEEASYRISIATSNG
jgi:hypothetical protein